MENLPSVETSAAPRRRRACLRVTSAQPHHATDASGVRAWARAERARKRRPRASQQGPKRSGVHLAPAPRIVNFGIRIIYLLWSGGSAIPPPGVGSRAD